VTIYPRTDNRDGDGDCGDDDDDERGDANVDGNGDMIEGFIGDVLLRIKLVTFLICIDSNLVVWLTLKATATCHRWYFIGNLEKERETTEAGGGGCGNGVEVVHRTGVGFDDRLICWYGVDV